ncbi:MAG: cytochrome P450 [Mycobacteriaceae bacterium]|nr:cytochrome P450 [Mycobacteriaceae bacterium]
MTVADVLAADAVSALDQARDPYPLYAWLREHAPVHEAEPGVFLLTRYADCRTVLTDARGYDAPGRDRSAGAKGPAAVLAGVMSGQRGERHRRMRGAVNAPWSAAARRIMAELPALCDDVLRPATDRLADGETVDLHEYAVALPVDTILLLLGLPLEDRDFVRTVVPAIFQVSGPAPGSREPGDPDAAMRQLVSYLRGHVQERIAAPRDDIISQLAASHRDHPELLDDTELTSILVGLMVAGFPQIAAGIETALVLLLRDERRRLSLREDPARFVDEVLRFDTPVQTPPFPRIPTRNVVLGDVEIPAGSVLWPLLGAANRDPAQFTAPDEFDPYRDPLTPLSFGGGIHHCLGARLACLEIGTVLRRLSDRNGTLVLAGEPSQRIGRLRGFTSVPVRLERGA